MTIPAQIIEIANRPNQEINNLEHTTTESLTIAQQILDDFSENSILTQMFAFLNSVL